MIALDTNGMIVIKPDNMLTGEDWLLRVRALMTLIQHANRDVVDDADIYHATAVLKDMMPDSDIADRAIRLVT
jgi:hypothetical protein